MKTASKNLYAQVLMAVVVVIGLYFMWSFAREVVQAQRLSNQVELGAQSNARLEAENRQLTRDQAYYQSDDYVRLRARTDLNLRDPNEIVVFPLMTPTAVAPTDASVAPVPPAAAPVASAGTGRAAAAPMGRPWERWLALLGGR